MGIIHDNDSGISAKVKELEKLKKEMEKLEKIKEQKVELQKNYD